MKEEVENKELITPLKNQGERIHDFRAKLFQPSLIERIKK